MESFMIELEHANEFAKIVDAISKIADQATFKISSRKMQVDAMDTSHICMVTLDLPKKWFKKLTCAKEVEIPIDVDELNRILKKAGDEILGISPDVQENKFCVTLTDDVRRKFRLGIYSKKIEKPPTSKLDLKTQFKMSAAILKKIIDSSDLMGDRITFTISDEFNTLTTITEGEEGNDVTIDFDDFTETPQIVGIQTAMYSLEYLKDIIKAQSVSTVVNVAFETEMPIKLEFVLRDEGKLTYVLSPRVEEEDLSEEDEDSEEFRDGRG